MGIAEFRYKSRPTDKSYVVPTGTDGDKKIFDLVTGSDFDPSKMSRENIEMKIKEMLKEQRINPHEVDSSSMRNAVSKMKSAGLRKGFELKFRN
jgi:hypothetical protein